MKLILTILAFFYVTGSFCQNKYPYNIQNKDQGTYLISVNTPSVNSDDSATLYLRYFELGENGCKELKKGFIEINKEKFSLEKVPDLKILSPVRVKAGQKILKAYSYFWLIPVTTDELEFLSGKSYNISFFLVRKRIMEE